MGTLQFVREKLSRTQLTRRPLPSFLRFVSCSLHVPEEASSLIFFLGYSTACFGKCHLSTTEYKALVKHLKEGRKKASPNPNFLPAVSP